MRRNTVWLTVTTVAVGLLIAWQANLQPGQDSKDSGPNPACTGTADPATVPAAEADAAPNPECEHGGKPGERK